MIAAREEINHNIQEPDLKSRFQETSLVINLYTAHILTLSLKYRILCLLSLEYWETCPTTVTADWVQSLGQQWVHNTSESKSIKLDWATIITSPVCTNVHERIYCNDQIIGVTHIQSKQIFHCQTSTPSVTSETTGYSIPSKSSQHSAANNWDTPICMWSKNKNAAPDC